jgi:hypothetical protein
MFCPFSLAPWFFLPSHLFSLTILHFDPTRTGTQRALDKDDLWRKSSSSSRVAATSVEKYRLEES